MVHTLAAPAPFLNGEGLILYHPSPRESYWAIAPGIEVSVEAYENPSARTQNQDSSIYNRQGKMIQPKNKGHIIDAVL